MAMVERWRDRVQNGRNRETHKGQTANWTCSDGNYVVSWSTGIDKLRISPDGMRLDGSNNLGQHASGIRK